jgi:hypothetical protein
VFFTLIGLAATVISIEKPVDPRGRSFDERLNIMFGHQKVPQAVWEYNRKSVQLNARYSSDGLRKIVIKDYKPEYDAYYVSVQNHYSLKSAIADFDRTEKIPMSIEPDPIANLESDEVGRVIGIRINNEQKITGFTAISKNGFATAFEETLSGSGAVEVAMEYEIYMGCGYEQSQIANRFAESITIEIVNQGRENVTISFEDRPDSPVTLLHNQPYKLRKTSVEPGGVVTAFTLHAPRGNLTENAGSGAVGVVKETMVIGKAGSA